VSCAVKKSREGRDHSPRWAAQPEKIKTIIIITIIIYYCFYNILLELVLTRRVADSPRESSR
jgi:hypothetical protein